MTHAGSSFCSAPGGEVFGAESTALPSSPPPILGCGFKSQFQALISSVFLCSQDRAEAAPRDAATGAESKEMRIGSHLIATAGMTESWGLIIALSFSMRKQCTLGFSKPPSVLKLCFPPLQIAPSARCHQSPLCSKGGRTQWEAGRHPAPSWVPVLRAGPGARSQNPAVGIWSVYLQSNNDPGTARRMSQLPVWGRIPH